MKKSLFVVLILLGALLTGCAAQETFETVSDEAVVPAAALQELSVTRAGSFIRPLAIRRLNMQGN